MGQNCKQSKTYHRQCAKHASLYAKMMCDAIKNEQERKRGIKRRGKKDKGETIVFRGTKYPIVGLCQGSWSLMF